MKPKTGSRKKKGLAFARYFAKRREKPWTRAAGAAPGGIVTEGYLRAAVEAAAERQERLRVEADDSLKIELRQLTNHALPRLEKLAAQTESLRRTQRGLVIALSLVGGLLALTLAAAVVGLVLAANAQLRLRRLTKETAYVSPAKAAPSGSPASRTLGDHSAGDARPPVP